MACSCVDCRSACKAIDVEVSKKKFEIFGWNAYGIIAGFSVLLVSTIFSLAVIWNNLTYEENGKLIAFKRSLMKLYKKNNFDSQIHHAAAFPATKSSMKRVRKVRSFGSL